MPFELVSSPDISFGGFAVLLELDGFLAAMIVRLMFKTYWPENHSQRGLRRRPSMLEHIVNGLQQQHLLNRRLRVECEVGMEYSGKRMMMNIYRV